MGTERRRAPNYILIADRIEDQIRTGLKAPGEKLAPIRQLAATEGVSINTVRAAMEILCQTGLVNSKPRRGLFVSTNQPRPNYEAFEYFKPDSRLVEQSRQWVNGIVNSNTELGLFANMVLPTDSAMFKSFHRSYRQSLNHPPKHAIETSAGNVELRKIISEQLATRQFSVQPAHIQITNGCQNAIEHALRVVSDPGDTIVIPTPAYPGYLALLSILKLNVIEIPMTPSGPDPKLLQKVMQSRKIKALIINPICQNPTGVSMCEQYKRDIAHLAEEYQTAIIEDDIGADLSFRELHPRPIASYDKQGWVLLVSSISKVIGVGERIGWCCPGRFKDAFMTQVAVSQIASAYYRQKALARYLSGTRYHSQLRQWRKMCQDAINQAMQLLEKMLGEKIAITKPSGSYSLWIKLPEKLNAVEIRAQTQQLGVDFLPGEFFSLENRFQRYLRLVIMPPFSEKHRDGLKAFAQVVEQNLK